jgi:predicted MFS family arabinose efflux permease
MRAAPVRGPAPAKCHYGSGLRVGMIPPPNPRRVLPGVYLSTLVAIVSYALLLVALPFRFEALGFSVLQYGVVLAVSAFGMLATESLWGALAFRVGRPRPIVALGGLVAAIILAVGLSSSVLAFAVSLGLLGMFVIFPVPLMRWLALTARGPGTGGSGTGRYGLFFGSGLVVGAGLGPLLYVSLGFLTLSLLAAGLSVVSTLFLLTVPWKEIGLPPRDLGTRREIRAILTPHFAAASLLVVLYFVANSLPVNFLQYYSRDLFGGTPTEAGYVIAATRAIALLAGFVLGPSVDRWGPARAAPGGFLVLVAGAMGAFFATSYAELIAATAVFAAGSGWLSASLLPLALGPVPPAAQGTAVGVFGSFEDFGLLIGPLLVGAVYAAYGARAIFPVVALVGAAGVVVALAYRRISPSFLPHGPAVRPEHG